MIETPPSVPARRFAPTDLQLAGGPPRGAMGDVPPSVGVLESIRRYPLLVALPVVLLVAAAIGLGVTRAPNYTATATLSVGSINLNAPGALAGFAVATQSLASQYSRTASSAPVVDQVAKRLGVEPRSVNRRIAASPIPESPVFRIEARGASGDSAIRLANYTADQLIRTVAEQSDTSSQTARLYRSYKETVAVLNDREARVDSALGRLQEDKSDANRRRLVKARASRDSWKLRAEGLALRYQAATQGGSSAASVKLVTPARAAKDDRRRWLEILVFAGLMAGLAVGAGLATWWANRALRRGLEA